MLEVLSWGAWIVAGVVVLFVVLAALPLRSSETPLEAADTIERFLAGQTSDEEWDDFTCIRPRDPAVQSAKRRVLEIEKHHSSSTPPTYLDASGQAALREVAASLRGSAA